MNAIIPNHPEIKVTLDGIFGFVDKYRYLSNFHLSKVVFDGITFSSSENAYQSSKLLLIEDKIAISNVSPVESRKFWIDKEKKYSPEKFDQLKISIMRIILFDKFTRDTCIRTKLLNTKGLFLEETNWWNDTFWGVCKGKGSNHLGKLLMEVRDLV